MQSFWQADIVSVDQQCLTYSKLILHIFIYVVAHVCLILAPFPRQNNRDGQPENHMQQLRHKGSNTYQMVWWGDTVEPNGHLEALQRGPQ